MSLLKWGGLAQGASRGLGDLIAGRDRRRQEMEALALQQQEADALKQYRMGQNEAAMARVEEDKANRLFDQQKTVADFVSKGATQMPAIGPMMGAPGILGTPTNKLRGMAQVGDANLAFSEEQKPAFDPAQDPQVLRTRHMIETGLMRDPNAPPPQRLAGPQKQTSTGPATDFGRKAEFMLEGVESAAAQLEDYDQGWRDEIASRVPMVGGMFMSEKGQLAEQAATTLADAYLRLTTGANYNEAEVQKTAMQMLGDADDKPATREAKRRRRQEVLRAIRHAAGKPETGLKGKYQENPYR